MQEFCNGGSLRDALGAGLFRTAHMPQRWRPLVGVLSDVAAGMEYMHAKRICHGDLNPSNLLIKARPSPLRTRHVLLFAHHALLSEAQHAPLLLLFQSCFCCHAAPHAAVPAHRTHRDGRACSTTRAAAAPSAARSQRRTSL